MSRRDLVVNILSPDGQTVLTSGPSGGTRAGRSTDDHPAGQPGPGRPDPGRGQRPRRTRGASPSPYTNLDQYETPGNASFFLPTAGNPASVRVADLSGNGLPDILVSSVDTSDTLQVLAGNADGTFQAPSKYAVGPGLSRGFPERGLPADRHRRPQRRRHPGRHRPQLPRGRRVGPAGQRRRRLPAPAQYRRRGQPRLPGHREIRHRRATPPTSPCSRTSPRATGPRSSPS